MPRGRKRAENGHDQQQATETVRAVIGGNIDAATMRKHHSAITRLEEKMAAVRQELKTAYDDAEKDGIAKKPFKLIAKLFKEDPATADAFLRQSQHYAVQLGLFDRIDAWKQAEVNEANAASVDATERELADA